MRAWIDRQYGMLLALQLALWSVAAWHVRFVLDDAFIALRYAENFAAGKGLVWNSGEYVEGYTSLLWTLLLAVPLEMGWDPIAFIHATGPLLLAATLACTARLAQQVLDSRSAALAVTLLLGSNATFLAYATGGLETQLMALVITALFVATSAPRACTPRRAVLISLLTAAALMTRLDAAIPAAAAWLGLCLQLRRTQQLNRSRELARVMIALFIPCLALVGAWFTWKLSFYGALLPNTFHAKVSGAAALHQGANYLLTFANSYLLWPCILLVIVGAPATARTYPPSIALLAALVGSYGYVASVGGDFMEFRFMVPTLPLLMCAIVMASLSVLRSLVAQRLVLALVVAGSFVHARTFSSDQGIESIDALAEHLQESGQDWVGIGLALNAALPESSDVRIATTAAGAIPYYSRLPAIDMLGLTDTWIARHGVPTAMGTGHSRVAPISHLVSRGVHLVFGHPLLQPSLPREARGFPLALVEQFPYFVGVSPLTVPIEASLLSIPIRSGRVVMALQLRPHRHIDTALRTAGWRSFALLR